MGCLMYSYIVTWSYRYYTIGYTVLNYPILYYAILYYTLRYYTTLYHTGWYESRIYNTMHDYSPYFVFLRFALVALFALFCSWGGQNYSFARASQRWVLLKKNTCETSPAICVVGRRRLHLYRRVQSMLTTIQRRPAIAPSICAMPGAMIFPHSARLPCKPPGVICGTARNIEAPSGPFRIESTAQSCRRTSGHIPPNRSQDNGHRLHRHSPRVATPRTPTSVPAGSIHKQDLWRLGLQIGAYTQSHWTIRL